MSPRRSLVIVLAFGLLGAVVWIGRTATTAGTAGRRAASGAAPGSSAQASPAPPGRSDPLLRPRPGSTPAASASAPPPEASRLLRVCARSAAAGLSLTSAHAYVVPKHVTLRRDETRVVPLDERGCAAFPGLDPRECWIGVRAEAHVAEVVDGDAWDGQEVQLTLAKARTIEVELRSPDGVLPPETWVSVASPGPRMGIELPGRGEGEEFWFSSKVERPGTIAFAPPTNGPVQVRVHAPGRCAVEGDGQIVPSERARATFTLQPACRIRLDVIDAESRQSLAYDAEVRVLDASSGEEVSRLPASQHSRAADWKNRGLRPGTYALVISAPGYLPSMPPPVLLAEPGAEVELQVPLELDPAAGRVVVRLELDEPQALGTALVRVQGRFLGARSPGWEALAVRALDRERATLSLWPLAVGEHDLMVWAGPRLVGRALVRVLGRRTDTARVRLQPGLLIDFSHCPLGAQAQEVTEEVGEEGSEEVDEAPLGEYAVTLRDLDGVELPEIRWRSLQAVVGPPPQAAADELEERGAITTLTVLGPFPCAEVQVYDAITEQSVWRVGKR